MKILFLHGWHSKPGGLKPTHLARHGHRVINPALDDDDFAQALRAAQAAFDEHAPDVVVGSSRGGAVAMNLEAGSTPLVLLCPAWKRWGRAEAVKPGTVILHARADEVIPFADSLELAEASGLPGSAVVEVGHDHRLADPGPLRALLEACEAVLPPRRADLPRRHGPWTILASSPAYSNPFLAVVEDRVIRPDGEPGLYGTIALRHGVAVLPIDGDGVAYLTREFRYAIGRESIEVPGGGIDAGESPLDAARREAREEVGIEASEWVDLGRIDPFTATIDAPVHLFLARGLAFHPEQRESVEVIETLKIPFHEVVRMVLDGEITHGPTCVVVLKARLGRGG